MWILSHRAFLPAQPSDAIKPILIVSDVYAKEDSDILEIMVFSFLEEKYIKKIKSPSFTPLHSPVISPKLCINLFTFTHLLFILGYLLVPLTG